MKLLFEKFAVSYMPQQNFEKRVFGKNLSVGSFVLLTEKVKKTKKNELQFLLIFPSHLMNWILKSFVYEMNKQKRKGKAAFIQIRFFFNYLCTSTALSITLKFSFVINSYPSMF